jgi:hypothetical protein
MRTSEIGRSARASSSRLVVAVAKALAEIEIVVKQMARETKRRIDLVI